MPSLATIDLASFARHLAKAEGLTVLEFGGPSCAPCVTLEPMLASLAADLPELVTIFKVDAEADPEFALDQSVRGLPTMLIFKAGRVVERLVGTRSREALVKLLQKHQV